MSLVIKPLCAGRLRKIESLQGQMILSYDLAVLDRGSLGAAG
jgi:hypothetical protein